ncbi:nitrate reductase molybdenum cofactor assembly chaperone [Malikia granosa]|uniref:Nitrate reductase molybdenum cofactor assembly chaperone n=1 Tax=Malikia granosa TaxID=263067 RepID=A0A2S9K158_9BURK|nr:nitrate reductase molybdenum cofactor assembly chaperone [Malikia granosa]PRD64162.1 nitrate reductase molybdenum cofactor assembly chaperone [Malikia granosa]
MSIFNSRPVPAVHTLRVLAHLLRYPDAELRAHLGELSEALHAERALGASRLAELDALLLRLGSLDPLRIESDYVELFDRGHSTSLHLFEHVHGDSRDRGPAMIDLIQTYEQAGLLLGDDELPDHLPVLLEFASTQPALQAREFLGEIAHIVRVVFSALLKRQSPYASVLAAVLDLAGEKAEPVPVAPEPELDESWAEPEAFDGCSSAGQAKPGAVQPIRIVKSSPSTVQGASA